MADVRVAASLDGRGRCPRLELAAANLANCFGRLGSQSVRQATCFRKVQLRRSEMFIGSDKIQQSSRGAARVMEKRTCRPYGTRVLEVALGYKHAAPTVLSVLFPL